MSVLTQEIQTQWSVIAPMLSIRSEAEYDAAINRLNALIEEIGPMPTIRFTNSSIHSGHW